MKNEIRLYNIISNRLPLNLSPVPHISGSIAVRVAAYGQGSGPITLDNVACVGTETQLLDCRANAIGVHNCAHSEDAGVICSPVVTPGPSKLPRYIYHYNRFIYCILFHLQIKFVLLEISGLWGAAILSRDVWRSASLTSGVQSVIPCGALRKPR